MRILTLVAFGPVRSQLGHGREMGATVEENQGTRVTSASDTELALEPARWKKAL